MLEPHRRRLTWDFPIHSVADVEALPFPPELPELEAVALRLGPAALRLLRLLRRARHRGLRRRPVRARARSRPDPAPRVPLPRGRAERRGAEGVQRGRPEAGPAAEPAPTARPRNRASAEPAAVVGSAHVEIRGRPRGRCAGGQRSGAAPVPVETRAEAILELNAAIEDERRALELLKKDPPHLRAARDRIYRSADRVNGVYDFLSGVPDAAAGQDALGGAGPTTTPRRTCSRRTTGHVRKGLPRAIEFLERALLRKRAGSPFVRGRAASAGRAPSARTARTTIGDGITDWQLEPGCSSSRDVRESSRFWCAVGLEDRKRTAGALGLVLGRVLRSRVLIPRRRPAERPLRPAARSLLRHDDGHQGALQDEERRPECGRLIDARFTTTSRTRPSACSSASSTSASARSGASSCRRSWCRRRPRRRARRAACRGRSARGTGASRCRARRARARPSPPSRRRAPRGC